MDMKLQKHSCNIQHKISNTNIQWICKKLKLVNKVFTTQSITQSLVIYLLRFQLPFSWNFQLFCLGYRLPLNNKKNTKKAKENEKHEKQFR